MQQLRIQILDAGSVPKLGIELAGALPFGGIRIVPMTVLVSDLPVLAANVELGALVLTDPGSGIDSILFLVDVAAAAGRVLFFDVPSVIGIRDYMM